MFAEGSHHQQGYVLITEMETVWILKEIKFKKNVSTKREVQIIEQFCERSAKERNQPTRVDAKDGLLQK
jgi:hypothetical protein